MPPSPLLSAAELEPFRQRGVIIPRPDLVAVAKDVSPEALAPGAVLHPFCRLSGAATRVGPGAVLGEGGAVTLQDVWVGEGARVGTMGPVAAKTCAMGPGTVLGSGAVEDAVFLGKEGPQPEITCGLGFRVRKGSLYEEDASSGQQTDTKMTVLFPWVTLGSNVNWCDLLMAGGTGPGLGDFSEVGSGAVHFNYSPRGDKATGSLLGHVTGVFLRSPRLFLGGNLSLLGPAQAEFGAETGAGNRYAKKLRAGWNAPQVLPKDRSFDSSLYGNLSWVWQSQLDYLGQLAALMAWYRQVRIPLAQGRVEQETVYRRGLAVLELNRAERVHQLAGWAARVEQGLSRLEAGHPQDPRLPQHRALALGWPQAAQRLAAPMAEPPAPADLRLGLETSAGRQTPWRYTKIIQGLTTGQAKAGEAWLQSVAQQAVPEDLYRLVPALS
ncbi:MAG: hypothetical protein OEV94_10025 [Deltaproteobacteria bacterium]|nr:hypothetical protein [Deltaproteobacteria bacterium]MDH4122028.1 hypothetical protein [Deltaproteobacteria bacterium]